jgi:hypothetical protein
MSDEITYEVSFSELSTYRRCRLSHHLGYRERWQRPQAPMSALSKGTAWHECMEIRYQMLTNDADEHDITGYVMDRVIQPAYSIDGELGELLEWMYSGYVEFYGRDSDWQVKGTEHQFKVPLARFRTPSGEMATIVFKARCDLSVWDTGAGRPGLWIVDHKSHAQLPQDKAFEFVDQFALQVWCARKAGLKVAGSIYNASLTKKNKVKPQPLENRFRRIRMVWADAELSSIAKNAALQAMEICANQLPVTRTYEADACKWCDFRDPCTASRRGRDIEEYLREDGFTVNRERH